MSTEFYAQDLKKRIFLTMFILLVYRFGTFVPIPGIDPSVIQKIFSSNFSSMFGMVNLFSGGALERMSVFALNIMPYITSSIIMQLITSAVPSLESLKRDGEYGRAKINQYTRYLTIALSFFQSIGVYYALSSSENNAFISDSGIFMVSTITSLVGGSIMLMWFGEKITSSGIGNGISLIIFIGIVSSLPSGIIEMLNLLKNGVYNFFGAIAFFMFFVLGLIIVSFVEKTQRRIKIQYPNSSMAKVSQTSELSFLPLKINLSGVIPPIFAGSVLMFPIAIFQIIDGAGEDSIGALLLMQRGGYVYSILFSVLILFFSYFYSSIIFNTNEVSENLKKSNCFVFGVRPGKSTSDYFDKIVSRLTLIGAFYLIMICVTPEILVAKYHIPFHIGGTGILIMVNVIIDLVNQIQSHLISGKYRNGVNRRKRVRVRI